MSDRDHPKESETAPVSFGCDTVPYFDAETNGHRSVVKSDDRSNTYRASDSTGCDFFHHRQTTQKHLDDTMHIAVESAQAVCADTALGPR